MPVCDRRSISDWILLFPEADETLEFSLLCPNESCGSLVEEFSALEFVHRDEARDLFVEEIISDSAAWSSAIPVESDASLDEEDVPFELITSLYLHFFFINNNLEYSEGEFTTELKIWTRSLFDDQSDRLLLPE